MAPAIVGDWRLVGFGVYAEGPLDGEADAGVSRHGKGGAPERAPP